MVNGTSTKSYPCMKPDMTCDTDVSEDVIIDGHTISLSFCDDEKKFFNTQKSRLEMCNSCQRNNHKKKSRKSTWSEAKKPKSPAKVSTICFNLCPLSTGSKDVK